MIRYVDMILWVHGMGWDGIDDISSGSIAIKSA